MICINCVEVEPLKRFVAAQGSDGECDYCKLKKSCVEKTKLFDYILLRIDEKR